MSDTLALSLQQLRPRNKRYVALVSPNARPMPEDERNVLHLRTIEDVHLGRGLTLWYPRANSMLSTPNSVPVLRSHN